jgi:alpha-1,2-mannosyltransferase
MSMSPLIAASEKTQAKFINSRRVIVIVMFAIPTVMLLISAILLVIKTRAVPPGLPWTYTESNVSALLHSRLLKEADSWYPMMVANQWQRDHHGGDVYQALFFDQHIRYQYPNTSLLFIEWLPVDRTVAIRLLNIGNLVLAAVNILGMMLLVSTLIDHMGTRSRKLPAERTLFVATAVVATACYFPILKALSLGQMQIFLDMLYTFSCYFLLRARPTWSGAIIGLSTLVKPQMGLFLVWAIIGRQTRFALGMASVAGAGFILSLFVYGIEWPLGYLHVLQFLGAHGESFYANQSVNGIVNRLLDNGTNVTWIGGRFAPSNIVVYATTAISTATLVAVGLISGLRRFSQNASLPSFLFAGICFTMASPIAWQHHYGILLPAFAFCFIEIFAREAAVGRVFWPIRILLAVSFILSANSFAMTNLFASGGLNIIQSYLFFAALGTLFSVAFLSREMSATP